MLEQPPDFQTILEAMSDANVRCVLIGGLAMSVHGSSHVTQDIDFGYSRDRANLAALVSALSAVHPRARGLPPGLPFIWDERTLRAMTNMTLDTDASAVDLLADISGVESFEALWDRSIETEIYDIKVRVASLEDLIAMKRAANRPKDQSHLLELLALKKMRDSADKG